MPPLEAMAVRRPDHHLGRGLVGPRCPTALPSPIPPTTAPALEQIQALLESPHSRSELTAAGRRQAWKDRGETCAEQVLGTYRRLLRPRRSSGSNGPSLAPALI
ncbi:MAG TPA: hypothetical protein DFS52_16600 [Myxococcales bacterium]|nr:hypothetical protein [Myxococcales bacterium]